MFRLYEVISLHQKQRICDCYHRQTQSELRSQVIRKLLRKTEKDRLIQSLIALAELPVNSASISDKIDLRAFGDCSTHYRCYFHYNQDIYIRSSIICTLYAYEICATSASQEIQIPRLLDNSATRVQLFTVQESMVLRVNQIDFRYLVAILTWSFPCILENKQLYCLSFVNDFC